MWPQRWFHAKTVCIGAINPLVLCWRPQNILLAWNTPTLNASTPSTQWNLRVCIAHFNRTLHMQSMMDIFLPRWQADSCLSLRIPNQQHMAKDSSCFLSICRFFSLPLARTISKYTRNMHLSASFPNMLSFHIISYFIHLFICNFMNAALLHTECGIIFVLVKYACAFVILFMNKLTTKWIL